MAVACWGCAGEAADDGATDVTPTGSIEGFTAPIDISVGELIVFSGDHEVHRTEFRDGQFRVDGLPAGVYRLEVRVFAYQTNDAARNISLDAGEDLDLGRFILIGDGDLMADIPRIRGSVRDRATGAPLANVTVEVTCSAGVCSVQKAVTDEDGVYEALAPTLQEVQVSFASDGHAARFLIVPPISAGQSVTLNTQLTPNGG